MNDESGNLIGSVTPGRNAVDEALGVTEDPYAIAPGDAANAPTDNTARDDQDASPPNAPRFRL
jgi:hypothetical protein